MNKSKAEKKLEHEHRYYDKKVIEITNDRKKDRTWETKELLQRHKKIKLALKDKLAGH
jgi:stress-induced morphogen